MHRFETIYHQLELIEDISPSSLHQVTKIIYSYYLTPKEKTYFRCLEMYYQNKKQRELSVLLNIDQPNLSAKFSKLRKKLKVVADFLLNMDHSPIFKLNKEKNVKSNLTDRQFEVLMYLLAGNKAYHISKFLRVSPVAIHQTVTYLKRKLPPSNPTVLFLSSLGSI